MNHTLKVDARAVMCIKILHAHFMYSGDVPGTFKNDDCILDGGFPQCRLEGIQPLEVRWVHLHCIPLTSVNSKLLKK